jgi:predicted glycogen debranching enzyme
MIGDLELCGLSGESADSLVEREWLVTNGLGGYASGTVLGPPTRKHHGLFVPNLVQPNGRHVLVSSLAETFHGPQGPLTLVGYRTLDGSLATQDAGVLERFALESGIPVWEFRLGGMVLRRRLVLPHGRNQLCVGYEVDGEVPPGAPPPSLTLRPFFTLRRHDQEPDDRAVHRCIVRGSLQGGRPVLEVCLRDTDLRLQLGIHGSPAALRLAPCEQHHLYSLEQDRGYLAHETHYSPGEFEVTLIPGARFALTTTIGGDTSLETDPLELFAAERQRVQGLIERAGNVTDPLAARLVIAADQFIVRPGNRPEEQLRAEAAGAHVRTVIAGYHWFGDWGRDTMISLEGLTLCTKRHSEAASILRTFAGYVKDGLLPNLFPEGARSALYHTVDATLWYFHALDRYREWTGDMELVRGLQPVLESICEHYVRGTHYGIGVDPNDGLVRAGAQGYQLTWMDAKAGDWVVTPRRGKPVEIQALWYNALSLMSEWRRELGLDPRDYALRAARTRDSFNARFWTDALGRLRDVVDGEQGDDDSGRPNQILSLSLRHPVLDAAHWEPMLTWVRSHLLTPYGLRTLDPEHPDFKPNYHGDLLTRDGAYHQGTVWPWLIGHYLDAELRLAAHAGRVLEGNPLAAFDDHLRVFGVGSIAEIFDAQAPYVPRGCIAQAWSVAEVLRARLRQL